MAKKGLLAFFHLVFACCILSSCASIVSKTSYPVAITSSPDQAKFTVTDKKGLVVHSGRTPETITLKSGAGYFQGNEYTVCYKKMGFEDKTVELKSTLDGWYVGNILFGGLIGILIVDPATGAMWKLPNQLSTSLDETLTAGTPNRTLNIVMATQIPPEYKNRLVPIN